MMSEAETITRAVAGAQGKAALADQVDALYELAAMLEGASALLNHEAIDRSEELSSARKLVYMGKVAALRIADKVDGLGCPGAAS